MQGLIQPGFSFQGLSEPVGMLLGGAQAQRQAQERQMSSLRAGLTAPDLQSAVAGAKTPQEVQAAIQAYQMGQQERKQAQELSDAAQARSSAIQHALQSGKPDIAKMLRGAPMSVINEYSKTQVEQTLTPEKPYIVAGNNIFNTETGTWETKPPEVQPQGEWKELSDTVLYNSQTGETREIAGAPKASTEKLVGELASTDNIIQTIERAQSISKETNKVTYDLAKFLPLTGARDLAGFVDTITANLAFDRLDQMRKDSKTGAALGSIAVAELSLLQRSLQALDPGSSSFDENLSNVLKHYKAFRSTLLGQNPDTSKYVISENKVYIKGDGENQWIILGEAK